jgi:hypothetical protein
VNPNPLEIPGPDGTVLDASADADVRAWEEIAPGRFMPRRVRGSCKGRVLG